MLYPLPANAVDDEKLNAELDKYARQLHAAADPDELQGVLLEVWLELNAVQARPQFEPAFNRIAGVLSTVIEPIASSSHHALKVQFLELATDAFPAEALARVLRRLTKDADPRVRERVRRHIDSRHIQEVALPATRDGAWSPHGWLRGVVDRDLSRHKVGKKVQKANAVPPIETVKQLCKLLDIRGEGQLGYFLVASDHKDGPYTRFTIPKSGGGERVICAPKPQLKWVQRRIYELILKPIPIHDAAHGFVDDRSILTNAQAHTAAKVVVKFDLRDFFPTIHYYRLLGLFASLGYSVGDAKFRSELDSRSIAPVLARLCCYTPDPKAWGTAHMPQGAPTSPALSNIICRGLDHRLSGLAAKIGAVYTRYADDLTISFRSEPPNLGRMRWWVDQICHQEGFLIHHEKYRVVRQSQRQLVTGLVVNDAARIPREDRRRFRAIVHNCQKHGLESQAKGNPRFAQYLQGFASYLHMVHPDEAAELLPIVEQLVKGTEGDA
jgi:RNA-directed DNA polymerase